MSVSTPAKPHNVKIFDILSEAKNVRLHFMAWLKEFYGERYNREEFIELHESIKIGILYNYLTKIGININVYKITYDVYFINHTDKEFEELNKIETIGIVEKYDMDFYIERNKKYEGNIMQGLKYGIIDSINFLNNLKWLLND